MSKTLMKAHNLAKKETLNDKEIEKRLENGG